MPTLARLERVSGLVRAIDSVASQEGARGIPPVVVNGSFASAGVRETRSGGHATSQRPSYIFILPWEVHFGGGGQRCGEEFGKGDDGERISGTVDCSQFVGRPNA
jgi:hypothetical protein